MKIKDKLNWLHEDFLKYCADAGKIFIHELTEEDFIAYRAEYSVSRDEIADLKKILYSEDTQEYSNVEDFELHKDILISDFSLNSRVGKSLAQSNLRRNDNKILRITQNLGRAKKIKPSAKKITNNVDKKSFVNNVPAKSQSQKKFQTSPYLNLIISALEKFIVITKFRYLPAQIIDKKICPFIDAYNFNHENAIKNISKDLTVAEFAEYLTNDKKFDAEILRDFADWLNFDLNTVVEKFFWKIFYKERELDVISDRADNKTLGSIGKKFGLTRERVRQIESTVTKRFEKSCFIYRHNIFCCVYAMNDGKKIITFDDLKKFIAADYAKILWYLAKKINLVEKFFIYSEEMKAIIFNGGANLQSFDITEFKNYLPAEIVEENIFLDAVENFANEKSYPVEFVKCRLKSIYKHTGKFFHDTRITVSFKCSYILKVCFQSGYKIDDETDFNKFSRYLKEFFNDEEPLTQRAVDAKIGVLGVLCGRGKYIHPDSINVPRKILDDIENFIENSERNVLPFKEIFKALKNKFVGTQITNPYILQGIIKFYRLPYELRRDYLVKSGGTDIAEEFNSFVKAQGEVTSQEIKREFISFDDHNISFILPRCPEVIQIGSGLFMHSAQLNLQAKDFIELEKFLHEICANNPVNSRQILNLFYERFFDFLSRNKIDDHEKLFGVLKYMFHDKFNFSRPYIAVENIKNLSHKKVLLRYLDGIDSIDIEDLLNVCNENKIGYLATSMLIENLRPEFIRVDEFNLKRPQTIGITDEIISEVCTEVKKSILINGGWLTAKNFDSYEWLPQLEIQWTDFLLESIIALAAEKISVIKLQWSRSNSSNAVFVSEDFADCDYKSFMLKILRDEDNRQPFQNQQEILSWLKDKGLCVKKLPKFLFDDGYIDVNGKIALQ